VNVARKYIEAAGHGLFWIFILSTINIQWGANWFDQSIRPQSPAPLSLILFILYFYVHTYFIIPRYFSLQEWKKYVLVTATLFVLPECIRMIGYHFMFPDLNVESLLFHRDSFIFGAPGIAFMAFNASLLYGLGRLWILNQKRVSEAQDLTLEKSPAQPYEHNQPIDTSESEALMSRMASIMREHAPHLNPELSLRDLAEAVDSTEKKVSYVLNHHVHLNFYEYVNQFRVETFKKEILKPENRTLSIIGVAMNCGFPSKSSFYRAFKSLEGTSPSEYLKKAAIK